jgi:hypothetical protein
MMKLVEMINEQLSLDDIAQLVKNSIAPYGEVHVGRTSNTISVTNWPHKMKGTLLTKINRAIRDTSFSAKVNYWAKDTIYVEQETSEKKL